jgi:S1-C subfamily serine protease
MTAPRYAPLAAVALLAATPWALAAESAAPPAPPAATSEADAERALAAARQRLADAAREVGELSGRLMRGPLPRAMLGVQIERGGEGEGARVVAVSPGGPAEAAGIAVGDRITAVDGKDLTREGNAGRELVRLIGAAEPDRKVKLKVVRDGKPRDVEVTARAAPAGRMLAMREMRREGGPPGSPPRAGDDDRPVGRVSPLAGMELATLSEQLGAYFGAKSGVLVVRAGRRDAFRLRDGDVIVAIDGREPATASHATRILRSYQRGEKLQIKVLRERKTQTLEVTLPG